MKNKNMNGRKYEILMDTDHQALMDCAYDEVGEITECSVLYQIRALRDLPGVKAGDLGGFIETENNLSQDGECWVYPHSFIFGESRIAGNAKVAGFTKVYDSEIYGSACIYGKEDLGGRGITVSDSTICGKAIISGDKIYISTTEVADWATIGDNCHIRNCQISGNTSIKGNRIQGEYNLRDTNGNVNYVSLTNVSLRNSHVSNYARVNVGKHILLVDAEITSEKDVLYINASTTSFVFFRGRKGKVFFSEDLGTMQFLENVESSNIFIECARRYFYSH